MISENQVEKCIVQSREGKSGGCQAVPGSFRKCQGDLLYNFEGFGKTGLNQKPNIIYFIEVS